MAKDKIRYMVERKRKNGQSRFYWQPDKILREGGWKMQTLSSTKGEAVAQALEYNAAVDNWRANLIKGPVNEKPGTVDALITAYKKSRHYLELADRTKRDYGHYLDAISVWAGDIQAASITAKSVQDLYEANRDKSPRKAMYLIQVLRLLFSYGERVSFIPKNTNPATRPGLSYKSAKGTIWTPEQVAHFVATADAMNYYSIGTAVMLDEWLGQRKGDIVTIPMNVYRDGALHLAQNKTSAEVVLPVDMVPALKARLEEQAKRNRRHKVPGTTLIQQLDGGAYSADGFSSAFERIRLKAAETMPALEKLVFKDLRHTAVTRLAEAGAEIPMIAAVTGHTFKSCQEIIDRYNIRTKKMAREAFQRRIDAGTGE